MNFDGDPNSIDIKIDPTTAANTLRIISRGKGNFLQIGRVCQISGHIFLSGGASLIIGDGVKSTGPMAFHQHEGSKVTIGDKCLFFTTNCLSSV